MTSKYYIEINSNTYSVSVSRSTRKSISLEVKPGYNLIVKAPFFILRGSIDSFLLSRSFWIHNQTIKIFNLTSKYKIEDGALLPFIYGELLLKVSSEVKKVKHENKTLLVPSDKDLKSEIVKWYKKKAREIITSLVDHYTSILGLNYNRICIKSQKTRWGSCSGKKNLNFNWKIILTKPELLNYLVIHEVCHLIHMDHSHRFWDEVRKLVPNFNHDRKELRSYGYLLMYFL